MQPQNATERNQLRTRFMVLYLVTLALITLIFAALWPGKGQSTNATASENKSINKLSEADYTLHGLFKQLNTLDEEALNAMTDSAYENNSALLNEKIEIIDKTIFHTEERIVAGINDLTMRGKELHTTGAMQLADSLSNAYTMALTSHRSLKNIRSVIALGLGGKNDNSAMLVKWQKELQNKDAQISKLERKLKGLQEEARYAIAGTDKNANTKNLQKQQLPPDDKLVKENSALREDNDRLIAEVGKLRKFNEQVLEENRVETKKKINDLTAQLYLEQIDCNLTRADAKEIVYNSKQRKELLSQALKMLANLSDHADANLREKLKEKSIKLQAISNTIRD